MQKTNIRFEFSAGFILGKSMEMSILVNNKNAWEEKIEKENFIVCLDCVFPCEIIFIVKGKKTKDTVVDINKKILQDKFLKIESVTIDKMPIKKWVLQSRLIKFISQDNLYTLHTNYFAYNGRAIMSLDFDNCFDFFLDLMQTNT